jgi:DegV family protein with EDD domain
MSDFVLSCCSTADLSNEWYAKRDIKKVCFHLTVGDTEYDDNMGVTITQEKMFKEMLAGANAYSSQVSTGEYVAFFEPFLKEGKDILHVTLSSGISGTINSAQVAKADLEEKYPDRKIMILDSLCGSSGYGMLVDMMADKRDEGASMEEVYAYGEANRLNVHHLVLSTDLTFLIKGGRVKPAAGALGKMLNICPFVEVARDGSLSVTEKVRTKKKAVQRLVDIMEERSLTGTEYDGKCFICYTDRELGEQVKGLVEERFPHLKGKIEMFLTGGVISVHLGPGTVVLFMTGKERTV